MNIFNKNKKIDKNRIKTWFVTGASSGIGHETCFQLLERGYNVVAIARRTPDFKGENVLCLSADVTKKEEIENAINQGIKRFGKIDVVLNSAGISSYKTVEEESEEKMRAVMETNFWGTYNTIHSLIGHFRENKNGTIINISSECGLMPRNFGAAYCSSKYAVEGLTSILWNETRRFCRVLTVEPAYFKGTEIGKNEYRGTEITEYKNIKYLPQSVKNSKNNELKTAVKFIIEEAEKEKMQRRLMLGEDIIKKIEFEINSLKNDLKLSKKRAKLCGKKIKSNEVDCRKLIDENKCDYLIVNFWDSKYNYGACITAWAMQELIKSFGFTAKLLDTGERTKEKWYKNSYMKEFADKYLDKTKILNFKQCKALSEYVKGAILGSDQVLRIKYLNGNLKKYFLSFLNNSKRKIAISPSFGVNKNEFLKETLNLNKNTKKYMKTYLERFDYLSSRELSGKEIYKDVFGLQSDFILDPVFLIDRDKYNEIITNSSKTGKNKIVSYVLDKNPEYENLYKHLEEKYKKPVETINRMSGEYNVEDWLRLINECEFLITDSFHGVCFAMIFNKPFICINNQKRGSSRLQTLIDVFEISENIKTSIDEIYNLDLQFSMDYSKINQTIEDERKRCLEIIRKVLLENYSNNKNFEQNKAKFEKFEKEIRKQERLQYYKYKILSKITLGKTRKKYKDKKKEMKKILKEESFGF